jgi:hypothetical protein
MTWRSLLRFFGGLGDVFGRLLLRYFRCADADSFRWLWHGASQPRMLRSRMPGGARSRHSVAWPGPSRQGSRRVNGPETPTDRPTKGRPARPVVHLSQAWSKCQLMVVQHPRSRDAGVGVPRRLPSASVRLVLIGFLTGVGNQLSPVKSQTCWGPRRAGNWFQKHRTRCLELSACCALQHADRRGQRAHPRPRSPRDLGSSGLRRGATATLTATH